MLQQIMKVFMEEVIGQDSNYGTKICTNDKVLK